MATSSIRSWLNNTRVVSLNYSARGRKPGKKTRFFQKNRFQLSVGGEMVVGRVEKTLENRGGIQFRFAVKHRRLRRKSRNFKMAEREGFEPPVLIRHSRFPGVRVKPLCHLSKQLNY